jgi:hypothetical protein
MITPPGRTALTAVALVVFCADYVYDEIEALFADLRVGWIKYFGASSSLRRAATQRVGLTKRHPPASFVSQQ